MLVLILHTISAESWVQINYAKHTSKATMQEEAPSVASVAYPAPQLQRKTGTDNDFPGANMPEGEFFHMSLKKRWV